MNARNSAEKNKPCVFDHACMRACLIVIEACMMGVSNIHNI